MGQKQCCGNAESHDSVVVHEFEHHTPTPKELRDKPNRTQTISKQRTKIKITEVADDATTFHMVNMQYASSMECSDNDHEALDIYKYYVRFIPTKDTSDTIFNITSNNGGKKSNEIIWSLNHYCNHQHQDEGPFHWAIFIYNNTHSRLCNGYFKILKDNDESHAISTKHLWAFLYFVHQPEIRYYLDAHDKPRWDQDITVHLDGELYTLKFFNGKQMRRCQAFSILKHASFESDDRKQSMDKSKLKKSHKIHALYFPKPSNATQWKWYDTNAARFKSYDDDELQILEFEASYYANMQDNFPISNALFRKKRCKTSIFDHCYLPRFNQRLSEQGQTNRYCMGYTLFPTGDNGKYDIAMDQIQIQSQYARTVIRYLDRKTYLKQVMENGYKRLLTTFDISLKSPLKWIAYIDHQTPKDGKRELNIRCNPTEHMTTSHTLKPFETSQGKFTTLHIKKGELITSIYGDYVWARFKRKKMHKYCSLVNGYWDISFNDDTKYDELRKHIDAMLTVLQYQDIQDYFEINKIDGRFLHHEDEEDEDDMKYNDDNKGLRVVVDEDEYVLLWYNMLLTTHAVYIKHRTKEKQKWKAMYIMFFPKMNQSKYRWQWYNNNTCKYMDYKDPTELMQLECSYLSNLDENYPNHVICKDIQQTVRYFSHCSFSTFRKHQGKTGNKRYVLRYLNIPELLNKLVVEQVAYTADSDFSRLIQRITHAELQREIMASTLSRKHIALDTSMTFNIDTDSKSFKEIVETLSSILYMYQQWIYTGYKTGFLSKLTGFYNKTEVTEPRKAIIKLQNDFNLFIQEKDKQNDPRDEMRKISDCLNEKLAKKFHHQSTSCICVERVHSDDAKEKYCGVSDDFEIITQQTLDSYHCVFLHLEDIKDVQVTSDLNDDTKSNHDRRASSVISYTGSNKKRKKFTTNETYDTGIRYYYWDYYRFREERYERYQDRCIDAGNKKADGSYYRLCDWFIEADAGNLKEEIVSFDCIGMGQYNTVFAKASICLQSDESRKLQYRDPESILENRYGLKRNDVIKIEHLLAMQLYCNFSVAQDKFTKTFFKKYKSESDFELKKRHSKCALWGRYLRECVEGFGQRLQKGVRGVPSVYYRGITKTFIFKKSILRFNLPMSTTVCVLVADSFAAKNERNDGLILTLKPHWGDYGGYIRAFNCSPYSDFPWEEEYLFVGGLEPLVIHNIREVRIGGDNYSHKLQAMNNIYQVFEGMHCKFKMNRKLIKQFVDNRARGKDDDYISHIFNCYCNDLRELTIKLRLMDKSYRKIANIFMDDSNTLKLDKIIKLFPKCKCITICDGYNYSFVPEGAGYKDSILCVIEECLQEVKDDKPLQKILLEFKGKIDEKLLCECQQKFNEIGWHCASTARKDSDDSNEQEFVYKISRIQ